MVPAVTAMGSQRSSYLYFVMITAVLCALSARAEEPECVAPLQKDSASAQTSFLVLPRGGYFGRFTQELQPLELKRLASQFLVRWVSVDRLQRRVVAQVPSQHAERWLKHLRAHPRVAGILSPSAPPSGQLAPGIDRHLLRYMKKMPDGVLFTVLVSFPNEELARPYLELLLRRKMSGSLKEEWHAHKGVAPVRVVRFLEDRIEVLVQDSNDRMMAHLQLIPATSDQIRAELVSAY